MITMASKTLHFYIVSNTEFETLTYLVVFISERACWSAVQDKHDWAFAVRDESFLHRLYVCICCQSLRFNRRKYKNVVHSIMNSSSSEVRNNLTALSHIMIQLISIVISFVLSVAFVYFHKKITVFRKLIKVSSVPCNYYKNMWN